MTYYDIQTNCGVRQSTSEYFPEQQMDAEACLRFPTTPFHHNGVNHHITACSPKGAQHNHGNSHGGRLHNGGKRCPRDCACTVTTGPLLVMGATSIQGVKKKLDWALHSV